MKAAPHLAAAIAFLAGTPLMAETHTETVVAEQRTSIALHVAPGAAQAFLPTGWVPANPDTGPNLTAIFMDRTLALAPDGKPLGAGRNRLLVLVVGARNSATGETRNMIVGGYSADPTGTPGAYKVYRPGTVSLTRSEQKTTGKDGALETVVEEHWTARGDDGATVTLDLAYAPGLPALTTFEQKNYSGAEPGFYRIYRGQQASESLYSKGVDKVRSVKLTAKGGAMGNAVNGTEQIVGVTSAPSYSRKTYLP